MEAGETGRDQDLKPLEQQGGSGKGETLCDLEIEASSDMNLVKKVKLMSKVDGTIEIISKDKSSVSFALKHFMGAEVTQHEKVDNCLTQTQIATLTLYYAEIKKGKVKFFESVCYSKDAHVLSEFKRHCIGLYYSIQLGESFHTETGARRRFLFFVSPASGKGKALKFYDQNKKYFE